MPSNAKATHEQITDEQKEVLVKLAQDYQVRLKLLTIVQPGLPAIADLRIALRLLKEQLDNGQWTILKDTKDKDE